MSREVHVRFCEGLRVKFPRSTHPCIPTAEGWLYLATIMDLYSRKIIGWSLRERLTKELVMGALDMARKQRNLSADLLIHSDLVSQYACSLC